MLYLKTEIKNPKASFFEVQTYSGYSSLAKTYLNETLSPIGIKSKLNTPTSYIE
jgi:hypothetical protein